MRLREYNEGCTLTADELFGDILMTDKNRLLVVRIGNQNYSVVSFDLKDNVFIIKAKK